MPQPAASRREIWTLWAVIALAVGLRLLSALYQGDVIQGLPGIHDQLSYDDLARQVISGHGFTTSKDAWPSTRLGAPTAHWSYLYTLYLAAVYAVVGYHPLIARLIQAIIAGLVHPWLAWRIGRRLFAPPVGLAAAGLTAVHAYFVYYGGALMTETFYIAATLWSLDLATRIPPAAEEAGPAARWRLVELYLLLGVSLGVGAVLRQVILLFVPFLFAWLWWRARCAPATQRRQSWRGLLAAGAVIAMIILPWTVRNYSAFGSFVLLNTSAGYAFFWANHPIHGTEFQPILPADGPSYGDLLPRELHGVDEAATDRALLRAGLRFVVDDPGRYARLCLSRAGEYFRFWPTAASGTLSNIARTVSFGFVMPFMLAGMVLSARHLLGRPSPSVGLFASSPASGRGIGLLFLYVTIYSLVHLLSWALIRYRLPVDAVLVIFAGVAVTFLANRWRGSDTQR